MSIIVGISESLGKIAAMLEDLQRRVGMLEDQREWAPKLPLGTRCPECGAELLAEARCPGEYDPHYRCGCGYIYPLPLQHPLRKETT